MSGELLFNTSTELVRVPGDAAVFIVADGNYSVLTTANGSEYLLTLQLGQVEKRIAELVDSSDNRFVRIGKSLIVNRDYITCVNPSRQRLTLSDCRHFKYDVSASKEALKALKDFIEKTYTP